MIDYEHDYGKNALVDQVIDACYETADLLPHLAEFMECNGYLDANEITEEEADAMTNIAALIQHAFDAMNVLSLACQTRWVNHHAAKTEIEALAHAFAE